MAQINVNLGNVKPLFSDTILTVSRLSVTKSEGSDPQKEIFIEFFFVDSVSKQVMSAVVIPLAIAKDFVKNLAGTLKKADEELKSKKLPKDPINIGQTGSSNYLG